MLVRAHTVEFHGVGIRLMAFAISSRGDWVLAPPKSGPPWSGYLAGVFCFAVPPSGGERLGAGARGVIAIVIVI